MNAGCIGTHITLLADMQADTHPVCEVKYVLSVTSRFSSTETPGEDRLRIFHSAAGATIKLSVLRSATAVPTSHAVLSWLVQLI